MQMRTLVDLIVHCVTHRKLRRLNLIVLGLSGITTGAIIALDTSSR